MQAAQRHHFWQLSCQNVSGADNVTAGIHGLLKDLDLCGTMTVAGPYRY